MFFKFIKIFLLAILTINLSVEKIDKITDIKTLSCKNIVILVSENESARSISKILEKHGIISCPKLFVLLNYISNKLLGSKLKTGEYCFLKGEGSIKSLKKIYKGKSLIRKITIPEGFSVLNILTILNENPYLKGEIEENIEEGSLFPSTYYYFYGTKRQSLIDQMKSKMDDLLENLEKSLNKNLPIKSKREILILASIIERESKYEKDKPQIASILIKRLKLNMRLQVDSTLTYFLSEGRYNITRNLNFQDLKIESKFNSYKYYGLPPTAISCPGLLSLKSVLNPPETDFLYFLSTPEGEMIYNKDFQNHVRSKNLQKYLSQKKFEK
ncbi:MAG: endolytic transglycosylase MltG [Rickettsia sp.]|nr:endolytic transglycosylase MltG [Rickettsia sp.]